MNFFIKIGEKIGLIRPSRIANVLDGVDPTDAVNVRQLNEREASIVNYREYRAMITQSGTNPPYADTLTGAGPVDPFVDTIEGAWSYNVQGKYYYTKIGAFSDTSKVEIFLGSNTFIQGTNILVNAFIVDDDKIELQVFDAATFGAMPVGAYDDGKIFAQPISIRIYN